jgi:hypothetical protein
MYLRHSLALQAPAPVVVEPQQEVTLVAPEVPLLVQKVRVFTGSVAFAKQLYSFQRW